ncbi:hypothetical protein JTE90_021575 [Oedothorax gibbosus]|uniref:Uncharacterized protein n=1 Tax=Oedothorax gibbosus TaxID=931172 RepID=A0AAV6VPA9_9ARAC|nr:hypothetical protein JTE90_021575 [Oedothorax gibbosus]
MTHAHYLLYPISHKHGAEHGKAVDGTEGSVRKGYTKVTGKTRLKPPGTIFYFLLWCQPCWVWGALGTQVHSPLADCIYFFAFDPLSQGHSILIKCRAVMPPLDEW